MITSDYREQNRSLHNERPDYGSYGAKWAETVWGLAHQYNAASVLDYGCGKQTLHNALREQEQMFRFKARFCCKEHQWMHAGWADYDPAIAGLDDTPQAADLVVCTDVLEHIEPECLDAVLDDIKRCTRKAAFMVIATRPAKKTLPDGRNAHLIQQPISWWLNQLMERFTVRQVQNLGGEFVFIGEPNTEITLTAERAA